MRPQRTQGVDGIGVTPARYFNSTNIEKRIIRNSTTAHSKTLFARGDFFAALKHWLACWNKNDGMKLKIFANLFCAYQMTIMNRVERPSHNSYSAIRSIATKIIKTLANNRLWRVARLTDCFYDIDCAHIPMTLPDLHHQSDTLSS